MTPSFLLPALNRSLRSTEPPAIFPTQRKPNRRGQPVPLVLLDMESTRAQLHGYDQDDLLALIEEGMILHAWDISLGRRGCLRIFPDCVLHYQRTLGSRPYPRTLDQVITQMLAVAGGKAWLTAEQLKHLFNCGGTHIYNLLSSGDLTAVSGTTRGCGPQGSARITIASVRKFFETRLP